MISGPRLQFDFVARGVTCPASIVAPTSGDLFVFLVFTGVDDSGAPINPNPTISSPSLVLKEYVTGYPVASSDSCAYVTGSYVAGVSPAQWVFHVPMTGATLAAALKDAAIAALIGEIEFTMNNPFSTHLGGSTLITRSLPFSFEYSLTY